MKIKVIILSVIVMVALLIFACKIGPNYHELMTGTVIEKYHFSNTTRNYSHDDLIMVVKYTKFITTKTVDATAYYGYNEGDQITFDEDTGENVFFIITMLILSILFIVTFLFAIVYEEPEKEAIESFKHI